MNEYLIDLNATQAAIRAGYSVKGASVHGSILLANPKVSAAIQAGKETLARSTAITAAGQDSPPDVIRKIRRFDKITALTKLGEHLGVFKKAETPLFSIADVLDAAERRLERMKAQQAQPKEDKTDE